AGEILIRLDDEEARARLASAQVQVAMRKRARNDQSAGKSADRRKAEDAVATAKRAGKGSEGDLTNARAAWTKAQEHLSQQQEQLRKVEGDSSTPLPTQNEGQLEIARAELRLAYVELEKLLVRAPIASTVLQVNAKVGELAAPSAARPLLAVG